MDSFWDLATERSGTAGRSCMPVPLADVVIDETFWRERLRINRERTIPFEYAQMKRPAASTRFV